MNHHDRELRRLGERCDGGQGYLFARPLAVDATETFLRDWHVDGLKRAARRALVGEARAPQRAPDLAQ